MTGHTVTPSDPTSLPQALFIDVRSAGEFARDRLDGAINLPLDELAQKLPALVPDRDRVLVLYCASGGRSAMGCGMLQALGYRQVSNGGGLGMVAMSSGRQVLRS